jgi:hypothetical protein
MSDLTRRRFLARGSVGVAAVAGAIAAVPGLAAALKPADSSLAVAPGNTADPLLVHVRDFASGEISMLIGTEQVVVRDHDLAVRLYAAAEPRR